MRYLELVMTTVIKTHMVENRLIKLPDTMQLSNVKIPQMISTTPLRWAISVSTIPWLLNFRTTGGLVRGRWQLPRALLSTQLTWPRRTKCKLIYKLWGPSSPWPPRRNRAPRSCRIWAEGTQCWNTLRKIPEISHQLRRRTFLGMTRLNRMIRFLQ